MNRALVALLALAVAGGAAFADNKAEADAYARLFDPSTTKPADLFASVFLAQVSEAQVKQIVASYTAALGAFRTANGGSGSWQLVFDKGESPSRISLDAAGKIQGLWFGTPTMYNDSVESLSAAFKALPGKVSVCVTKDGVATGFALDADAPMGVGSSFKLYILKALSQRIASGAARWGDVVPLQKKWMSLPSGFLQTWPDGTPVTLATLADLMISQSDNTAADHLLYTLGRSVVESVAPARVRPFLSTRELFAIKWGMADKDRAAYVAASPDQRAALLAGIGPLAPDLAVPPDKPVLIDSVEWLITTRELCQVIYDLRAEPAIAINTGLVDKGSWSLVGYKGGSEPGVLNYTHVLRKTAAGPVYAVSATINDPAAAVDTNAFTLLVMRVIGLAEKGKL